MRSEVFLGLNSFILGLTRMSLGVMYRLNFFQRTKDFKLLQSLIKLSYREISHQSQIFARKSASGHICHYFSTYILSLALNRFVHFLLNDNCQLV